jgi:hypothetical protein
MLTPSEESRSPFVAPESHVQAGQSVLYRLIVEYHQTQLNAFSDPFLSIVARIKRYSQSLWLWNRLHPTAFDTQADVPRASGLPVFVIREKTDSFFP